MSRATVDLQSIRFFLGYGLIWVSQSALTILFAAAAMIVLDPVLALLALAPVPFLVATATRYSRRNRPAEQEVQQRIGEVTASAEESISGIRIVKAFARERHMLGRFTHSVNRVFEQSMVSTRLQAFYTPLMGFLPNLGLAAVLLVGGLQVIHGGTSIGHLTAFYAYVVLLSGPVRWLGMSLSMAQRAVASGNRMFEILDREPSMESPPGAPPLPEGRGQVSLQRRDAALRRRRAGADGHRPGGRCRAARSRWSGPTAAGKTSLVGLLARLYDPSEGRVVIDGADIREVDLASLRSEIAFVADDSFLFSDTVARQHRLRPTRCDAGGDRGRRAAGAGARLHHPPARRLRHGDRRTRPDALRRAAPAGRDRSSAAGGAAHPDPGRRDLLGGRTHRGADQGADCARRWRAGRRSSSPTASPRSPWRTRSWSWTGGRIVDRGTHEELLERCPLYEEIAEKGLEDSVYLQRDLEEREELAKL